MKVETNSCLLSRTVKSLAYLQAKVVTCCRFMGAGRRHKTPKREAKDFTTRGSASGCASGSHGSSGAPVPTGQWPGDDAIQAVGLNHSGGSLNCGNPKLRKPKARIKQPCLTCVPKGGIIILDSK